MTVSTDQRAVRTTQEFIYTGRAPGETLPNNATGERRTSCMPARRCHGRWRRCRVRPMYRKTSSAGGCILEQLCHPVSSDAGKERKGPVLTCAQWEPVVKGVDGRLPAGEHVFVEVRAVLKERVPFSRHWPVSVVLPAVRTWPLWA
jgi:hypothetical protein